MITNTLKPKNRFLNYLYKNRIKILVFVIGLAMIVAGIISNFQNIRTQIARAGGIITYQDVSNISCDSSINASYANTFECTITTLEDMSEYTGDLSIRLYDGNTYYGSNCDALPSSGFLVSCAANN